MQSHGSGDVNSHLTELATLYAIQPAYENVWQRRTVASREALVGVLERRGIRATNDREIESALLARRDELASRCLEPVIVAWGGVLRLPPAVVNGHFEIRLESGESIEHNANAAQLDERLLPFGYHTLRAHVGGDDLTSTILSAPETTWQGSNDRIFGLFAPLYSLRSRRDWGCGDFSEASRFIQWAEFQGACFAGVLPLLASYLDQPFEPSPYAPVSRLFWNELFVDVVNVPDLALSPEAQQLLESSGFRAELARLRFLPLVDYRASYAAKRRVLDHLSAAFFACAGDSRREKFEDFLRSKPMLDEYARFRAATEERGRGFRFWNVRELPEGNDTSRVHAYSQFLADEQLAELSRAGGSCSLYLDFPLGTNRDGFDVWRFPHLFARDAAIGAPPDFSYATGQNWGFPPFDPDAIRDDGYRLFAASVRHHMSRAGLLRLDHVMSLHRLYWIPDGMDASNGVYVRYRDDELYAVLCIESHRARCVVIGEDLGTVPPYVRDSMDRRQLRRLFVLQRQLVHAQDPPGEVVGSMVASLNNHDMPPFAGFWKGRDIEERSSLGMIDAARVQQERTKREHVRQLLVARLRDDGLLKDDSTSQVARAAHRWLARSCAAIVLVSVEDLWGETESQNVPTTTDQRPNWRRKFALTIEEIEQSESIAEQVTEIRRCRTECDETEG